MTWNKGLKMSDEYKQKLSDAHKGQKRNYITTDETRSLISEARKKQIPPMLGKKHSEATIEKMSEVQKRTRHSPHTEESKAKMSIALTNAWNKKRGYEYISARDEKLKRDFGISEADYLEMLDKQGGVCAICKRKETGKYLAVDHDHETGVIRGLLCQKCNTGLGLLSDTLSMLERAVKYLRG